MDMSVRGALLDEIHFLFSGQGMPYEKVCLLVAMVASLFLGLMLSGNISKDADVAIIDLDNSAYTRKLANDIDASKYMHVSAIINTPVDPATLFYQDRAMTVVYFPPDLEKSRYTGESVHIGVYYDNTNTSNSADIKSALNEIVGIDNARASGDTGSTNDTVAGSISLADRNLFNPNGSNYNVEVMGFIFFFGSMFFVFATIGMVPRLRLTHQLDGILLHGTSWNIAVRLVPYGALLIISCLVGLAVMRVTGDLTFTGQLWEFLFVQVFVVATVGLLSLLFSWKFFSARKKLLTRMDEENQRGSGVPHDAAGGHLGKAVEA